MSARRHHPLLLGPDHSPVDAPHLTLFVHPLRVYRARGIPRQVYLIVSVNLLYCSAHVKRSRCSRQDELCFQEGRARSIAVHARPGQHASRESGRLKRIERKHIDRHYNSVDTDNGVHLHWREERDTASTASSGYWRVIHTMQLAGSNVSGDGGPSAHRLKDVRLRAMSCDAPVTRVGALAAKTDHATVPFDLAPYTMVS